MKTSSRVFFSVVVGAYIFLLSFSILKMKEMGAQLNFNRKLLAEMEAERDGIKGGNPIAISGPIGHADTVFPTLPIQIYSMSSLPLSIRTQMVTASGKIVDDPDLKKEIDKYSAGFSLDRGDKGIWICDGQYYFHFIVAKGVLHLKSRAHWTSETCPPHGGD